MLRWECIFAKVIPRKNEKLNRRIHEKRTFKQTIMKKERFFFLWMLLGILFLSACSDSDDPVEPFKIKLNPETLTLRVGETAQVSFSGAPELAEIVWQSTDEKVALVSDGEVKALAEGVAFIRVTASKDGIKADAQCEVTVEIEPMKRVIEFEDPLLKQKLLEIPGLDANGDQNIIVEEALTIHKLEFSYRMDDEITEENTFTSLEGLQHFANLDTLAINYHRIKSAEPIRGLKKLMQLHLGGNPIPEVDLSELTALKDLRLFKTGITSLDLKNNTALEVIDIYSTALSALNLSPLKNLSILVARQTKIASLKVADMPLLTGLDFREGSLVEFEASNLPFLEKLYLEQNQLQKLTLTNLPALQHLVAYENKLTKIDFDLPKLMFLTIFDNAIAEADFSKMPMLFRCYMSNNLITKADFSLNPLIAQIELQDMPNLEVIDLKNDSFMDAYEYMIFYNNPKLHTIRVDSGAEEDYVRGEAKNFPNINIVIQ